MKIELDLERPDELEFEYDVVGGEEDQEETDHWATFERFEEAVAYKAEQEAANARLRLHIARKRRAEG